MIRKLAALSVLLSLMTAFGFAKERDIANAFSGIDLNINAEKLTSTPVNGNYILLFENDFIMTAGPRQWSAKRAVIWLDIKTVQLRGIEQTSWLVKAYLEGSVEMQKNLTAKAVTVDEMNIPQYKALLVSFDISGEVIVTAHEQIEKDVRDSAIYKTASSFKMPVKTRFYIQPEARMPEFEFDKPEEILETTKAPADQNDTLAGEDQNTLSVDSRLRGNERGRNDRKEPIQFRYPIHWRPINAGSMDLETVPVDGGLMAAAITQPVYVWQKLNEKGDLIEFRADGAVIYFYSGGLAESTATSSTKVKAIYLTDNVLLTEGIRNVRADELYYDFETDQALILNAEMRSYDQNRNIPIYIRAAKLRQMARDRFVAEDVVITSSEFNKPQLSAQVSRIILADERPADDKAGSDARYDLQLQDTRLKWGDSTIFRWPYMRSGVAEAAAVPIKRARLGYDSTWGASIETDWYLSRLLGLREAPGTDSTLNLDYYGKRGAGAGFEIEYEREDYFGQMLGYIIQDSGEDRLGRTSSRKNLEPDNELRGRAAWRHRQYLDYNWQLTSEIDYISDRNFYESYYRSDFYSQKEPETYLHLKRIEDNWGLSILGKARINDHEDQLEELPTLEYHRIGDSIFDDQITFYNDTQVSRLRSRLSDEPQYDINEDFFGYVTHRSELDYPLRADSFNVVPYVAGTFGYDDRSGFNKNRVDGTPGGEYGESDTWIAEAGVRVATQFWKINPDFQSRIFDLDGIRHIVEPELTAAVFKESDDLIEQQNMLNLAVTQRWQTKRGPADNRRTVDWLRIKSSMTWVDDSGAEEDSAPYHFIWNNPATPLRMYSHPSIFNGDIDPVFHRVERWGPERSYFSSDMIMRLGDTTALMGDFYYDTLANEFEQASLGISRLVWPNLSYYIGTRYLRNVQILDEKGSNTFTFGATYVIDPRYTLVFAQQFDFDYGVNNRSDITLIRRYHRIFYSFTYSFDGSLDRQAVVFSIWPQGVPELGIGQRGYMGIGGSAGY